MKRFHTKPLIFKTVTILITICSILVIHSCKKDKPEQQTPAITDPLIAQARQWYESTYPVHSGTNVSSRLATQSVGTNTAFDLTQAIKPNWLRGVRYSKLNQDVIQLPVDSPASVNFDLKNMSAGTIYSDKKYSRTYFLIMNDGNAYQAYVMTVIADPSYVKNDLSKLSHNTYQSYDADFSGIVLYFTPKGDYINGYAYQNGQLLDAPVDQAANNQTVQSTSSGRLKIDVSEPPTCYDYYFITYDQETGEILSAEYLYTLCNNGGSSGGGSSSGGVPAPPAPPCKTPPANSTAPARHLAIAVTKPPTGGGGTGFPPPQKPCTEAEADDPCATAKTIKANTIYDSKLTDLNSYTSANIEHGWFDTQNADGTYSYKSQNSTTSDPNEISFTYSTPMENMMHSHFTGQNTTFDGGDIDAMYSVFNAGKMANSSAFTSTVVTPSGTYMLTISDLTKFKAFAPNSSSSLIDLSLKAFGYNSTGTSPASNAAQELALTEFLQTSNGGTGLTLLKLGANGNFNTLNYNIDNNQIIVINCN